MPTHFAQDNVVSLASARAHRSGKSVPELPQQTLLVQASNIQANYQVYRQIGLDAAMSLKDLHTVIDVAFATGDQSPWHFENAAGQRLDPALHLGHVLRGAGDELYYLWGLWRIEVHCFDSCPRDAGTPRALCIGGSGSFGAGFDQAAINAELTGTDTIRNVLASVRPEVVHLVDRTGIFDFIPLLQALDLHRQIHIHADVSQACRSLPVEHSAESSDAFWSCVLALSCLGDDELFAEIITSTMSALGWVDDDGGPLAAPTIVASCAASLEVLAELGAYQHNLLAPVERLDIYRELLRP